MATSPDPQSDAPSPTPDDRSVSASRTIAAPPAAIFAVLADPSRHKEIDGSATVLDQRTDSPQTLELGSRFSMNMTLFGLRYRMTNEVVEFNEPTRIAWRHLGRHIWRYELSPSPDNQNETIVTETFDWSSALTPGLYERVGYPRRHVANMTRTLKNLEQAVTSA